jgi:predicted nucleic acid-binding protein
MNGVVIDTNVFVAAGFNSKSAAARILAAVREGRFQLVWNKPTRRETETILRRIPGLDSARVADLFRPEGEFTGPVDPDAFVMIADRDDRKFVVLSAAATTPLVTNDNHVLAGLPALSIWASAASSSGEIEAVEYFRKRGAYCRQVSEGALLNPLFMGANTSLGLRSTW